MSMIPRGTRVDYTVTFLEMPDPPAQPAPDLPADLRLERAEDPPLWWFFALYDVVGRDWEWRDMHDLPEAEVEAYVRRPDVEIWTAMGRGFPQGFFMLDFREAGVADLAYFGLVPEAVGQGLGGPLLRIALAKGWARQGVSRMTVNTCTLDHPAALEMYKRAGFVPYRTEDRSRILTRDRPVRG